ncbi:hypothetical protein HQ524_02915 [Candidatus Uhrbacteria bacterium]|nr:hypothetical protein [Candidatus Uhrbacteria bacterium]
MAHVRADEMRRHLDAAAQSSDTHDARANVYLHEGVLWTISWGFYDSHRDLCRAFWSALNDRLRRELGIHVKIDGFMVRVDDRQERQGAFQYFASNTPADELPDGRYWGR